MSVAALANGDVIDRYSVVGIIGRGGRATVYQVRHTLLGTRLALKVLSEPSGEERTRLLREGRAQASLRHPNVVPVLDVLSLGSDVGLLLELVDGPDLARWMVGRAVSIEQVDRIAEGLFAGMETAHAGGFVHRDLKPSNVLVHDPEGHVTPRVTDFGLVKATEDDSSALTHTGGLFGTPAYAAPEQIGGARRVDARADVFSLGAVLYEVATGRRAFPGADVVAVLQAAADERYVDPAVLRPELPARIRDAIRGALCVDIDERWPDIATFRDAWRGEEMLARAPARSRAPTPPGEASSSGQNTAHGEAPRSDEHPTIAAQRAHWGMPMALGAVVAASIGILWVNRPAVDDASDRPAAALAAVAQVAVPTVPVVQEVSPGEVVPASESRTAASVTAAREDSLAAPARRREPGARPATGTQPAPVLAAPVEPPPSPATTPEVPPHKAAPAAAWLSVGGDAAEVVLLDSLGKRTPIGAMAPGDYTVEVRFQMDEPRVNTLRVTLSESQSVEVSCNTNLRRCSARPGPSRTAP